MADPRSNSLIVRAANPARLAQRARDHRQARPARRGPAARRGNIWVVHLKNADATKLAHGAARGLPAGGGGGGGGGHVTSPHAARSTAAAASAAPAASAAASHAGHRAAARPRRGPSTGGFIQADPSTNSLIITAPEPLYRQVRAMIDQLDTRRAQVYIESLIVEVIGDNAADFGFQWQGLIGQQRRQVRARRRHQLRQPPVQASST